MPRRLGPKARAKREIFSWTRAFKADGRSHHLFRTGSLVAYLFLSGKFQIQFLLSVLATRLERLNWLICRVRLKILLYNLSLKLSSIDEGCRLVNFYFYILYVFNCVSFIVQFSIANYKTKNIFFFKFYFFSYDLIISISNKILPRKIDYI